MRRACIDTDFSARRRACCVGRARSTSATTGASRGEPNAWLLTADGHRVLELIGERFADTPRSESAAGSGRGMTGGSSSVFTSVHWQRGFGPRCRRRMRTYQGAKVQGRVRHERRPMRERPSERARALADHYREVKE